MRVRGIYHSLHGAGRLDLFPFVMGGELVGFGTGLVDGITLGFGAFVLWTTTT